MVQISVSRRHLVFLSIAVAVLVVAIPLAVSAATQRFVDVPPTDWAYDDVEWLAANSYTEGCTTDGTEYCPDSPVTRREMAAFMHRLSGDDATTITGRLDDLEAENAALKALLTGVTRNGDVLEFSGMNLQVVNGLGNTSTSNSLGNVIIGYNEDEWDPSPRTGSHYLVVGKDHSWTSWAGIVAGYKNTASASHASVTGGFANTASWEFASVTGGSGNNAAAMAATISGGEKNSAINEYSSVSGGRSNNSSGPYSSVSGGSGNTASAYASSVLGGLENTASINNYSSVSGGEGNTASGYVSAVSGGRTNTASGSYSSVSGGSTNTASGSYSSVSGGSTNTATDDCTSVVGGDNVYLTAGGLTCRTAGEGFWNAAD